MPFLISRLEKRYMFVFCFSKYIVSIYSRIFFRLAVVLFNDAKEVSSCTTEVRRNIGHHYWWNLSLSGRLSRVSGQAYSLPDVQSSGPGTSYHTPFSRFFSTQYKVSWSQQSCVCQFVFRILVTVDNKLVLEY